MKSEWKVFSLLSIIFIFASWIRWDGIFYGLPHFFHPDEVRIVLDTLSMGHRHSLLPERPDYALLYRYFLLFVYGLTYAIGHMLGYFKDTLDFAYHFMTHPEFLFFISRVVVVLIGSGCCLVAYFIGKHFFSFHIGIISAVFVAIEIQLVQHSQYAIYSIPISFFILLVFYFLLAFLEKPSLKNFIKACLIMGLAMSVQNQAIFILPSCFAALGFIYLKHPALNKSFFKKMCLGLSIFLICSLMGNLYWIFDFKKTWIKTSELIGVSQVGFSSIAPYSYSFLNMLYWFFNELLYQDKLLGFMMLLGIGWAILRHSLKDIIFLLYCFINLFFFSRWGDCRSLHHIIAIVSPLCIWGAKTLVEMIGLDKRKILGYCLISIIVTWSTYQILIENSKKNVDDTRLEAKEWIETHIPSQSHLVLDWPELSVPLQGERPWIFYNPVAKQYYEEKLNGSLKERYQIFLNNSPYYHLSDGRNISQEPVWPSDMPKNVIERAKKKQVFIDLYSHFHFKPIHQLIKEKAEYLIVSSFSYGYFLLDGQPGKERMFNVCTLDSRHLSIRHTNHFIDDDRHGFLFFLAKEGREFYEPLLYNRLKNALLIKEFIPQKDQLGPIIKVYKLIKEQ